MNFRRSGGGRVRWALAMCGLFASLGSPGCDDGLKGALETPTLDCAWIKSPDNCWYRAVQEAYEDCSVTEQGEFSADAAVCSYANGDGDRFEPALAPANPDSDKDADDPPIGITATRGGSQCFSFTTTQEGERRTVELTTRSGTVTSVETADTWAITCPDGQTVDTFNPHFYTFVACNDTPPGSVVYDDSDIGKALPSWIVPTTGSSPTFDMYPHPAEVKGPLVDCAAP